MANSPSCNDKKTNMAATKKKSVDSETNKKLRALATEIKDGSFGGYQNRTAVAIGVSGSFLSEFLGETRGAGVDLIAGIAKYRPLETLRYRHWVYSQATLLAFEESGADMGELAFPEELRRAARAAMELLGCTADEVLSASQSALLEYGEGDDRDPDWWLGKLRQRVPTRRRSGVRRKAK